MNSEGYRVTTNSVEDVVLAGLLAILKIDDLVIEAESRCEPCIFVGSRSYHIPRVYSIRKYNGGVGSSQVSSIVSRKWGSFPIYSIFEEPGLDESVYRDLYRSLMRKGNVELAKKAKSKIILPEGDRFRGVGFLRGLTDVLARNIALKRADQIARKLGMPVLGEVAYLSS